MHLRGVISCLTFTGQVMGLPAQRPQPTGEDTLGRGEWSEHSDGPDYAEEKAGERDAARPSTPEASEAGEAR